MSYTVSRLAQNICHPISLKQTPSEQRQNNVPRTCSRRKQRTKIMNVSSNLLPSTLHWAAQRIHWERPQNSPKAWECRQKCCQGRYIYSTAPTPPAAALGPGPALGPWPGPGPLWTWIGHGRTYWLMLYWQVLGGWGLRVVARGWCGWGRLYVRASLPLAGRNPQKAWTKCDTPSVVADFRWNSLKTLGVSHFSCPKHEKVWQFKRFCWF